MTIYGHVMKKDQEKEIVTELCRKLIEERKQQELSQQRLSELAGISRTGLRHMESLETNPTLYTLLKVAKALDYSVGTHLLTRSR